MHLSRRLGLDQRLLLELFVLIQILIGLYLRIPLLTVSQLPPGYRSLRHNISLPLYQGVGPLEKRRSVLACSFLLVTHLFDFTFRLSLVHIHLVFHICEVLFHSLIERIFRLLGLRRDLGLVDI